MTTISTTYTDQHGEIWTVEPTDNGRYVYRNGTDAQYFKNNFQCDTTQIVCNTDANTLALACINYRLSCESEAAFFKSHPELNPVTIQYCLLVQIPLFHFINIF